MKNKKFIQQLLITFLILKTVTGFAKENKNQYFKLNEFYKTSKFLKNNTCIIQDNNNIYWAATKDNIFFFNGNYFQPINLKITNCKDLFFDSKNNLWANTKNGYQLIENIYSTPNFSKKINTKNISSATPYKNNIWYFENEIGLVNYDIIKQTKKIIKFPKNSSIYKEKIIKIIIQENKIIALSSTGNILVYNTLSNSFYIAMLSASKKGNFQNGLIYNNTIYFYSESSDMLCYNLLKKEYIEKSILKSNYNLIGISCITLDDKKNELLIGTRGQGLFIYNENENRLNQILKYDSTLNLSNNYISHLYVDKNNNLIISYDGNNFDIFSNSILQFEKIKIENIDETYINTFTQDNFNNIWVNVYDKCLLKINVGYNNNIETTKINLNDKKIELIRHINNKLYIINNKNNLIIYDITKNTIENTIVKNDLKNEDEKIYDIKQINGLIILSSNYGNIFSIENDIIKFKTTINNKINTEIFSLKFIKSALVACSDKGIFKLEIKNNEIKSKLISTKLIKNLISLNELEFVSISADSGLTILDKNFKTTKQLIKNKQLNIFKDIKIIKNKIWANSENSIFTITNSDQTSKNTTQEYHPITGFENYNFLQDGIINLNNTLYFIAEEGIVYTKNIEANNKINQQEIFITNVELFNQPLKSFSLYENNKIHQLPFYENSITVYFTTKNFNALPLLKYQYKLEGYNKDWIEIENTNNITFQNLPPNSYTLKIRTSDDVGNLNNNYTSIKFNINSPFYYKWWFILGSILFLTSIIYLIYKNKIKQIQKEEKIKSKFEKELVNLEMTALRAQINPHFIFNSLNSINSFILKNENDKARKYLVRFSQLVRTILTHSSQNFVTLDEELKSLKLYLEIESMRFDNQFNYEININENINLQQTKIPSMLLQPYVENAIWHGLIPKNGNKNLKISIDLNKFDILEINIEDNGIGINNANAISEKSSKNSKGMSLGENRIKLLNNKKASIKIIDLHSKNNQITGTLICISLPLDLK